MVKAAAAGAGVGVGLGAGIGRRLDADPVTTSTAALADPLLPPSPPQPDTKTALPAAIQRNNSRRPTGP